MPVLAVAAALVKPSIERTSTKPSFVSVTKLSASHIKLALGGGTGGRLVRADVGGRALPARRAALIGDEKRAVATVVDGGAAG